MIKSLPSSNDACPFACVLGLCTTSNKFTMLSCFAWTSSVIMQISALLGCQPSPEPPRADPLKNQQ